MRGIILGGGTGSRLLPLTKAINKHLLPVYDRPLIYYPIQMFVKAGIKDIMIVTGGNHVESFVELLGDGSELGASFQYAIQIKPDGIAGALKLAEGFVHDEPFVVCLGDNIFQDDIVDYINNWSRYEAKILVRKVDNPQEYGVLQLSTESTELKIVEKPRTFISNLAVTGLYMYTPYVFKFIKNLVPSKRNELEITDVNNMYAQQRRLVYEEVNGWWLDAGESIDALHKACIIIAKEKEKHEN